MSEDADHQIATDIPKDTDKYRRTEHSLEQSDAHADRHISRDPSVLGNPIFGIFIFVSGEREVAKEMIGEPTVNQVLRQPSTPPSLRCHLRPNPEGRYEDACAGKRQEQQRLGSKVSTVSAAKGVKEISTPIAQTILDHKLEQHAS
jgi:hypothetical protein